MSDRNIPTDLRLAFEEWCRVNCSPGAHTSEWYWRLFQGGAEAQRQIDTERRREQLYSQLPETSRE